MYIEPKTAEEASARYEHDCVRCEYVGQWKEYDLYVCNRTHHDPSALNVVARYGNDGPEYLSGLHLVFYVSETEDVRALAEALLLAKDLGLLREDHKQLLANRTALTALGRGKLSKDKEFAQQCKHAQNIMALWVVKDD